MKIKKHYLIFFSVLILLFLYLGLILSGYSLTEESAIRNSFPNQSGEIAFEKEFDTKKVIVWDTGTESYVKLISKDWGIFSRAIKADAISVVTPDKKMIYMVCHSQE